MTKETKSQRVKPKNDLPKDGFRYRGGGLQTPEAGGVHQGMTDLELAFQMAKSGEVSGLTEIIHGLKRKGRSANQIEGPALRRQLINLIKAARG